MISLTWLYCVMGQKERPRSVHVKVRTLSGSVYFNQGLLEICVQMSVTEEIKIVKHEDLTIVDSLKTEGSMGGQGMQAAYKN